MYYHIDSRERYRVIKVVEAVEVVEEPVVIKTGVEHITCYTWTGNTMANGMYPEEGYVANNQYPFGTVVEILGGTYTVGDRIGHGSDWDIYMDSYDECKQFGRRYDNVKIIK